MERTTNEVNLMKSNNYLPCYMKFLHFSVLFYPFSAQSQLLMTLNSKLLGKIEGKGENAFNQHFLHFPQFYPKQISVFPSHLLPAHAFFGTSKNFCHLIKR